MRKLNVVGVSALLALAVVLGTIAATRSVALGTTRSRASDAAIQERTKRLDTVERSLQRALAQRLPALPSIPKAPSGSQLASAAASAPTAAAPASPVKVVYRRPAPVVLTVHRSHGDDGESEGGDHGGGDD